MTVQADYDVGPLSWVKGEIDVAMRKGIEALQGYASNAADSARIKLAQAQLHQAHGALQIVGLDGVTRVSEELENLLADVEREPALRNAAVLSLAQKGFEAVVAYLDKLLEGSPNQPLRLLPVYRELCAARGKQAADPVDLYYPDLSPVPPLSVANQVQLRADELGIYLREQRARFQRGLLKWLKGDPAGAQEMRAAVEAVERTQGITPQRAFLWVALAFFDALADKTFTADAEAKRLCNRIEQQLRRLVEGSQNVAERLMREVLYFVARAKPAGEHVRAVQTVYRLAATLPPAGADTVTRADPPALKTSREALVQAKDAWNKFASGHAPSLIVFQKASSALKDRGGELGHADVSALTREIAGLAAWLGGDPSKMSEAVALEVATALLLLENALGNFFSLGSEYAQQAQFVCGRLKACVLGTLLRTAPQIPLLDEMSRKAQERLLMSQVVAEMQANLRAMEQTLDEFFRDPSKQADLGALARPAHQVEGALEMLGETRARELLAGCEAEIRRFAQADYAPRHEDFDRVAQKLSGLGFYIDALGRGKADFDQAMRPIAAQPAEQKPGPSLPSASVEAHIEDSKREAEKLYEKWKKKPTDTWLKQELQKNLAAMQKDAGLVADVALEGKAQEALRVLEDTAAMPYDPTVTQSIGKISPAAATEGRSPEAEKLIEASTETIDAELLAVYLEEATEVLASIGENLAIVRAHTTDKPALTVIRRGFHTLKGSGRMVGLMRLGEAAWGVEQVMNLWLQEERAASPELLRLVAEARDYFADNVERLKSGGGSSDEQALVALAEKVKRGEPLPPEAILPSPAPAVAAPAPQEPGQAPPAKAVVEAAAEIAPAEAENLVEIGPQRISATLFEVFATEAKAHIEAMRAERETLRHQGIVTDALVRRAHTLAGICGTVKVEPAREVSAALERTLGRLATTVVSQAASELVCETIDVLGSMVAQAISRSMPGSRPDLLSRLEQAAVREVEAAPKTAGPLEPAAPALPAAEEIEPVLEAGEAESGGLPGEMPERRIRRIEDDLDPHLLPIFLEEAQELVPAVGSTLRDWHDHFDNRALGQSLQRLLHTLKGGARMAGAMVMGELTHRMETRVENALSLESLPATLIADLEASYDRLGLLYDRLRKPETKAVAPAPEHEVAAEPRQPPPARPAAVTQRPMLRVPADTVDRLVVEAGEVAIARSRIEGEMRSLGVAMQELTDNVSRLRSLLREIEIQAESQIQSRMQEIRDANQGFDPLEFDRFTRFQELTRLMAESVNDVQTVHQNLLHAVDGTESGLAAQARLNRDLQQDLMRVRMVPFASIAERLYRIARQTSNETGKRVHLDLRGSQVELDRSVLERITAPFEHLLRNAISHGVESPQERSAAGKPEIGEVLLEVSQEGNEVQLSLADDGRGLNIGKIREKAVAMGMLEAHAVLSDKEVADLIFQPGLSTAEQVTELSGRGVGMDVLRTEVTALGGRIELAFEKDKGTRVTVYLPLTLAVTQAVLVRSGSRTCAIPAVMVEQVMQYRADPIAAAYASRQVEWQARRYPFHYLPHLLGVPDAQAERRRFSPVLFLRSGTNAIALHVDEMIGGNREIVVKAIGPQLQRIRGITGATVLGTGEIVLILNPVQLALREALEKAPAVRLQAPKPPSRPAVMIVDDSLTVRKVTARLLQREGYEVLIAKDGVDAMEKLQDVVPDVMLVDIEMPRMDGFDLTRNIRADARLSRVPIIMITSRTADKHQNYAREIGVNVFLGKPYQESVLLGHISGFIAARQPA